VLFGRKIRHKHWRLNIHQLTNSGTPHAQKLHKNLVNRLAPNCYLKEENRC
jgi:hypothetical protein